MASFNEMEGPQKEREHFTVSELETKKNNQEGILAKLEEIGENLMLLEKNVDIFLSDLDPILIDNEMGLGTTIERDGNFSELYGKLAIVNSNITAIRNKLISKRSDL